MRILVAYASRHGATAGIAQRLGEVLEAQGMAVDVRDAADARRIDRAELERYDAFVIGAAIYAFHWLGDARDFVRAHAELLRGRPVWLFGSGPVGDRTTDDQGHDFMKPPAEMASLSSLVHARDSRIFFGAYDPDAKPIGLMEHFLRAVPAGREALPAGDFRNWDDIELWARSIARELSPAVVTA